MPTMLRYIENLGEKMGMTDCRGTDGKGTTGVVARRKLYVK
jgi:hypothetical protein